MGRAYAEGRGKSGIGRSTSVLDIWFLLDRNPLGDPRVVSLWPPDQVTAQAKATPMSSPWKNPPGVA